MAEPVDDGGRRRKQLIIGGSSTVLLVLLIAGVVASVYMSSNKSDPSSQADDPSSKGSAGSFLQTSTKSVDMVCSSTNYKETCKSSLSKAVSSENPDPQELVKAAISVLFEELTVAFDHAQNIKTDDPQIKGAIDDCRELFDNSKEELQSSLDAIVDKGLDQLPAQSSSIQTWLSAVMSYQETCIDGFPEGEMKQKLRKGMQQMREMTSNALAIIDKASDFFSMLGFDLFGRRRLMGAGTGGEVEEWEEEEAIGWDDLPEWITGRDRRSLMQEGKDPKYMPTPNVTVAQDGSGQFTTINAALAAMPKEYEGRYVIYIKPGVYEETVAVNRTKARVTMYGDTADNTIVTGSKNFIDGTRTFQTATFAVTGPEFLAMRMTFRNSAGAIKHQAVALRVQADMAAFLFCRMEGYQDTLYAQALRQFYRSCIISGTIDFVFGDAKAVFQNCIFVVRRPLDNQKNIVTAQGRIEEIETSGFVLHRCRFVPEPELETDMAKFMSYLGRPWKEASKIVIMESELKGSLISPDGYLPWEGDFGLKTLSYTEFNNTGERADVTSRVKWPGVYALNRTEALKYTVKRFLEGDNWLQKFGVPIPVRMGLYSPPPA